MNNYRITNTVTGFILGTYPGDSVGDAHLAMAIDAGFGSIDEMNIAGPIGLAAYRSPVDLTIEIVSTNECTVPH